jgi:hypothetical protein
MSENIYWTHTKVTSEQRTRWQHRQLLLPDFERLSVDAQLGGLPLRRFCRCPSQCSTAEHLKFWSYQLLADFQVGSSWRVFLAHTLTLW